MAEKTSTKSTRFWFPLNTIFWLSVIFFFFVVGVAFANIFSIDFRSLPTFEGKRGLWTSGVFSLQMPRVLEQFFVAILRSPWVFPRLDDKNWQFGVLTFICQIKAVTYETLLVQTTRSIKCANMFVRAIFFGTDYKYLCLVSVCLCCPKSLLAH